MSQATPLQLMRFLITNRSIMMNRASYFVGWAQNCPMMTTNKEEAIAEAFISVAEAIRETVRLNQAGWEALIEVVE